MGPVVVRRAVRVEGVVQGVGFRPFVYTLATGLGLTGLVGNDLDGVFVEVEGPVAAVSEFLLKLERDAPPLARIERVITKAIAPTRSAAFAIAASQAACQAGRRLSRPRRTAGSARRAGRQAQQAAPGRQAQQAAPGRQAQQAAPGRRGPTGPPGGAGRWSRRTPRPAPTACASLPIRPTGGSVTRSSTAPTAGPGSPSSGTCPTTGR